MFVTYWRIHRNQYCDFTSKAIRKMLSIHCINIMVLGHSQRYLSISITIIIIYATNNIES